MTPQNFLAKWKNKTGATVRKTILLATLSLGTLAMAEGTTLRDSDSTAITLEEEPLGVNLEIQKMQDLPSVTLVDKHLNLVAQFYGDAVEVKKRYEKVFKEAQFLMEYNGRRVYLVPIRELSW